jgi:ketol-acid reductoisomerase
MPTILREAECPQAPILGWTLAVLGYGNQGRAQALNLRDSGHAVVVGARPGGSSAELASQEGFAVVAPEHLPGRVDLVAVLTPDETHRDLIDHLSAEDRGRIKVVILAHGFALRFDPPSLDSGWDVAVVAPAGPGVQLRSRFLEGSGLPALLAVHQDGSGEAEARARAYAAAIGCARAGVLRTDVAQEVEVDLFGEQAVLCGGMSALCQAAFQTLVDGGYPPEMAYLECVQQLRLTAELVERHGIEGMRRRISPTALYGDLTRGPRIIDETVRRRLAEILGEIRSGVFAREWMAKKGQSGVYLETELSRLHDPLMEEAGRTIRGLYAQADGPTRATETRGIDG